jgi:hypothetical protein
MIANNIINIFYKYVYSVYVYASYVERSTETFWLTVCKYFSLPHALYLIRQFHLLVLNRNYEEGLHPGGMCNFVQLPINSFLLCTHILLNTIFSTLNKSTGTRGIVVR